MTRSPSRPEPTSVKDRIKVMEPSPGDNKRRESESDTVSPTKPKTYKGNPVKLRFEPVLGHVRPVPKSANHTAPAQLVEPFHREGEGSMLPLHAFFSRAEVLHWNNFQRQVAHRYGREVDELDFDTQDEEKVPEPRPHSNETTHSAPDVPYIGLQDSIGWATLAAKEGRTDVHPDDTEAKAALTKHLSDEDAWNKPWKFDENLGAGSANPIVPIAGLSEEKTAQLSPVQRRRHRIRMFMLRNVFVPLILRGTNVIVLSATMGIGARLRMILVSDGAEQSVGLSPLCAIVFSPPSIIYALTQIWIEYSSRPIGLWKLSSKLWYTALELIFLCLWSAELSLSLDNYFTSTIVCVSRSSAFYAHASQFATPLNNPNSKDSICSLQIALICVVFVSLAVYLIVFMVCDLLIQVSLFRIFHRIRV